MNGMNYYFYSTIFISVQYPDSLNKDYGYVALNIPVTLPNNDFYFYCLGNSSVRNFLCEFIILIYSLLYLNYNTVLSVFFGN